MHIFKQIQNNSRKKFGCLKIILSLSVENIGSLRERLGLKQTF